jgi:hypothetical protein
MVDRAEATHIAKHATIVVCDSQRGRIRTMERRVRGELL